MNNETVKKIAQNHFDLIGVTSVGVPATISYYENWIAGGEHGRMEYLKRHIERKKNPQMLLPGAKSWIAVAFVYDTDEPLSIDIQDQLHDEKLGWISRYARGGDYHDLLTTKLNLVIQELQKIYPNEKFLDCVDFKAVLERDVATHAGLGWIGKNTCLINKEKGSFLFLSEILTTLDLDADTPATDHCGTCDRCLVACPTGALVSPRHLDARKCISYWTIEDEAAPPLDLGKKFGSHVFGCDICQDVCPWNKKARRQNDRPPFENTANTVRTLDLRDFISWPTIKVSEFIKGTALERAGPEHLMANARRALENIS